MRLNIFLAVIVFINCLTFSLTSCDSVDQGEDSSETIVSLDSIIQDELESGEINNEILLGFELGMSENEFWKRTKRLVDEGKLYDHKGVVTYDLSIDETFTYRSSFSPKFHNDSLYSLGVSVKSDIDHWDPRTINMQLALLYMDKYGAPDFTQQMQLIEDCEEYHWIDGNRHIEIICGVSDARIFYKDVTIMRIKEQEEENDAIRKKGESLSDI